MITLLKEIAIRPLTVADAYNSVHLTNIMEGVDGAATFGYSLETVAVQVEDNQTQQYKHVHTFDIRVIEESSDVSIIDAWIASQTRVEISGRGLDGMFVMSNVLLTRNTQYDGILASAYLATAETVTSYSTGQPVIDSLPSSPVLSTSDSYRLPVFASSDLMQRYNLDITKSNVAFNSNVFQNGWRPNTDVSSNHSGSTITVINTVNGKRARLYGEQIYAPYTDQIYKATLNVVDFNAGSTNVQFLRLGIAFRGLKNTTNANVTHIVAEPINSNGLYEIYAGADASNVGQHDTRDVSLCLELSEDVNTNIVYDSVSLEVYPSSTLPAGLATYVIEELT